MRGMHLRRRVPECRHGALLAAPLGERIATRARDPPEASSFVTRIGERHEPRGAESDVAALAGDDGSQHPPLCAGLVDEEVEAVAVRVAARTFEVANANCVQALVWVRPARFHNPDTPRV